MAEDWSREEVEATVADYFDMLDQELRGQPYNKTAHRRLLSVRLRNRSDGAIERKHQNISAILLELGFIPIRGYKPASNYQGLLADVVSARYEASIALRKVLERQVQEPAVLPSVEDILRQASPSTFLGKNSKTSPTLSWIPVPLLGMPWSESKVWICQ